MISYVSPFYTCTLFVDAYLYHFFSIFSQIVLIAMDDENFLNNIHLVSELQADELHAQL